MDSFVYCKNRHRDGWHCLLREGHDDDCLSIDNQRLWHGTPGYPIRWGLPRGAVRRPSTPDTELGPREVTGEVPPEALDPTLTQGEAGVLPTQQRAPAPRPPRPRVVPTPPQDPPVVHAPAPRPPPVATPKEQKGSPLLQMDPYNNGRACDQCGSLATRPDGSCFKCLACGYAGTCGG